MLRDDQVTLFKVDSFISYVICLSVSLMIGEGIDATEILSEEDIVIHRDQSAKNKFEFDRILSPGTPQEAVFEAVQPLIVSVLDGYNVCIFACKSFSLAHIISPLTIVLMVL
jgi:hypothetical protein